MLKKTKIEPLKVAKIYKAIKTIIEVYVDATEATRALVDTTLQQIITNMEDHQDVGQSGD